MKVVLLADDFTGTMNSLLLFADIDVNLKFHKLDQMYILVS